MKLRLLSYNIRFGGHGREALIAKVVRAAAPDLVIFQEAYDARVVEYIAREAGIERVAAHQGYSLAAISNVPISEFRWHQPVGSHHPFIHIDLAPAPLRIFGVHLRARLASWDEDRRVREVRALLEDIKAYRTANHLLVGDFNTVAQDDRVDTRKFPWWLRALIWFSGRRLQRRALRVLHDDAYVDGYRSLHPDELGYTLPTPAPHIRLDYLFLPTNFARCLVECQVVCEPEEASRASDHFPLLAILDV